jgi:hypothetical protein
MAGTAFGLVASRGSLGGRMTVFSMPHWPGPPITIASVRVET